MVHDRGGSETRVDEMKRKLMPNNVRSSGDYLRFLGMAEIG